MTEGAHRRSIGAGSTFVTDAIALIALAAAAGGVYISHQSAVATLTRASLTSAALNRASHAILMAPYAVLSILEFDDNTDAGRNAPVAFRDAVREAKSGLSEAKRLTPERSAEIGRFGDRFEAMLETAEAALAIGNRTPGLTSGADLSAADLVQLEAGARLAAEADSQSKAIAQDVSDFDRALAGGAARSAAGFEWRAETAIAMMAAAAFVAAVYFRISGRRRLLSQLILRRTARWAQNSDEFSSRSRGSGSSTGAASGRSSGAG